MNVVNQTYASITNDVAVPLDYDASLPDPSQDQLPPLTDHARFELNKEGSRWRAALIWEFSGREHCRLSLLWPVREKAYSSLLLALPKMTCPVPHRLLLTLGFMAHIADQTLETNEVERWFPLFDEVRESLDAVVDVVHAWWLAGPSISAAKMRQEAGPASTGVRPYDPEDYLGEIATRLGQGAVQQLHCSECIASELLKMLNRWTVSLSRLRRQSDLSRLERVIAPMALWVSTSDIAKGKCKTEMPRTIQDALALFAKGNGR